MRSGLQLKVICLYRDFIRTAHQKQAAINGINGSRDRFVQVIRAGFRKYQEEVSPRDVATVEYLLRRGQAQLESIRSPDVTDIHTDTYTDR